MEEVNVTVNVTGYAWECKQATGTHSHLCTNLSLQPGRRNGANSKLSPFDTRSACRRQGWLLFLQMLSSCWCFWKEKGILTGGCGPAPILPGRLQSSSLPISPLPWKQHKALQAQEAVEAVQSSGAISPVRTAWLWDCTGPCPSTSDSYSPGEPHLKVYVMSLLTDM